MAYFSLAIFSVTAEGIDEMLFHHKNTGDSQRERSLQEISWTNHCGRDTRHMRPRQRVCKAAPLLRCPTSKYRFTFLFPFLFYMFCIKCICPYYEI